MGNISKNIYIAVRRRNHYVAGDMFYHFETIWWIEFNMYNFPKTLESLIFAPHNSHNVSIFQYDICKGYTICSMK